MRYCRMGILLLTTVLFLIIGVGGAAAQWSHSETTGAAVPMPEPVQNDMQDEIDQYRDYHSAPNPHVWLLHTESRVYIVVSPSEPTISRATVEGETATDSDYGVILADRTQFDTTPQTVDGDTLANTPEDLVGQYVTAEVNTTQSVLAYDGAGGHVRQPQTSGIFQGMTVNPPAEAAQYNVWNKTDTEPSLATDAALYQFTGKTPHVSTRTDFAIDNAPTRVEGLVLPRAPGQTSGQPVVYLTKAEPVAESVETDSVLTDPGEYSGEVVEFDADLFGGKASAKRVLVRASPCDGSETIGVAPTCAPAVTDTQIHTGIAVAPSHPDAMLAYGGLSNHLQSQAVEPVAGQYTVTARVVPGSDIHPSINGHALEVYGLDRQGEPDVGGAMEAEAEAAGERVLERVRKQLVTPPSQQSSYKESARDQSSPVQGPQPELDIVAASYRNNPIAVNETVTVDANVRNVGDDGALTAVLHQPGGRVVDSKTINLRSGETREITLQYVSRRNSAGTLRHYVNGTDVGLLQFAEETDTATQSATDGSVTTTTEEDGGIPSIQLTILAVVLSLYVLGRRRD